MEYSSAGILFQDTSTGRFLSGWNPKLQAWSGFGGRRQKNETAWETAVREVIEELFGVRLYSRALDSVLRLFFPMEFYVQSTYVCYVCPIERVFELGQILEMLEYKSPFYKYYPRTTIELLETRTDQNVVYPEITSLRFLDLTCKDPMDKHFKSDLEVVALAGATTH